MTPETRSQKIARLYLGGLLAAMALGQAVSPSAFLDALDSYGIGTASTPVGWALLAAEAIAAGLLLARPSAAALRRFGAWTAAAVAVAWTLLAAQAFARGLVVPNCGCFGAYLTQELRWWVLAEDVAFVWLAAAHLRHAHPSTLTAPAAGASHRDRADERGGGR